MIFRCLSERRDIKDCYVFLIIFVLMNTKLWFMWRKPKSFEQIAWNKTTFVEMIVMMWKNYFVIIFNLI